jgi:hypothetical protein
VAQAEKRKTKGTTKRMGVMVKLSGLEDLDGGERALSRGSR